MRALYLTLAVLGAALPLSQFVPFLLDHGLDLPLFFDQLFANRIAAFFGWDVIVSAFVVIAFVVTEGRRLSVQHWWVYILATLSVGVSLGLPLFLYAREGALAPRA